MTIQDYWCDGKLFWFEISEKDDGFYVCIMSVLELHLEKGPPRTRDELTLKTVGPLPSEEDATKAAALWVTGNPRLW